MGPTRAIAEGVFLTRDLVSEPPNVLDPGRDGGTLPEADRTRPEGRSPRPKGDAEARLRRSAGRCQGSVNEPRMVVLHWNGGTAARAKRRKTGRVHRQGRDLRYRWHQHQARRRHGGHEVGHGRRRHGHRPDGGPGRTQGQGRRGRAGRSGGEHAVGHRAAAGRRGEKLLGSNDRGDQYRCGRTVGAGGCTMVLRRRSSSRNS